MQAPLVGNLAPSKHGGGKWPIYYTSLPVNVLLLFHRRLLVSKQRQFYGQGSHL